VLKAGYATSYRYWCFTRFRRDLQLDFVSIRRNSADHNSACKGGGNLFIADEGNARFREVVHATGVISTIAGNRIQDYGGDNGPASAAELNGPWGVAVDAAGDLFIADTGNNRVREVASGAAAVSVSDPWVVEWGLLWHRHHRHRAAKPNDGLSGILE
jgi:hypothetical protein